MLAVTQVISKLSPALSGTLLGESGSPSLSTSSASPSTSGAISIVGIGAAVHGLASAEAARERVSEAGVPLAARQQQHPSSSSSSKQHQLTTSRFTGGIA